MSDNKPTREPSKALRDLLENSVVMSSTEDDVTICVTAKAYEDAYKTAYPDADNTQEAMAANNPQQGRLM
jgi:hypothetical protein